MVSEQKETSWRVRGILCTPASCFPYFLWYSRPNSYDLRYTLGVKGIAQTLLFGSLWSVQIQYLSPVKWGYCFRFVCLSDRLSGTLFSHFLRLTPTVFITHKPNLYHLKAGCLECVMEGGSVFSYPQKFRQIRFLKTAQNHEFQFLERHKSKSFRPIDAIPIPHESPASVV